MEANALALLQEIFGKNPRAEWKAFHRLWRMTMRQSPMFAPTIWRDFAMDNDRLYRWVRVADDGRTADGPGEEYNEMLCRWVMRRLGTKARFSGLIFQETTR